MPSYDPVVKNGTNGAIFYLALPSLSTTGSMQANPTLAAGDVKISLDGSALNNLTTLPAVTPAAGVLVKVTLSQAETNADNLAIVFIDQTSPKEWSDTIVSIQTAASNFDTWLDTADAVETGLTVRQLYRLMGAVLVGKVSGAGTASNTFRNAIADSKNRVISTVDGPGNRTAITYDVS